MQERSDRAGSSRSSSPRPPITILLNLAIIEHDPCSFEEVRMEMGLAHS